MTDKEDEKNTMKAVVAAVIRGCMPISMRRGLMIMPPPIPKLPPKNPARIAMLGKATNALGPIKSHSSG